MKASIRQSTVHSAIGIWLFSTLLISSSILAQAKFIVWKNGKEIGKMETYVRQTAQGKWYGLTMEMRTKVIASFQVRVQVLNFFDAGNNLVEASYSRSMNNAAPKQHTIRLSNGGYELALHGNQNQMFTEAIQFSSLQLYFQEPLQVTHIFSENHSQNLPLKCLGKGVYSLLQPDGYTTIYWYTNGMLEKIEGDSMFGKVQFIRS